MKAKQRFTDGPPVRLRDDGDRGRLRRRRQGQQRDDGDGGRPRARVARGRQADHADLGVGQGTDVDGRVGGAVGRPARRRDQADQGQQVGQVGRRQDGDRPRRLHDRPDQVPGGLERHRGSDRHRRSRSAHATALSGTAADFGNWSKAATRWFKYYSRHRACSRTRSARPATINYSYKDDGYDAARTIPIVDELLDSDKVFALWTLGTPVGPQDLRQDQPALRLRSRSRSAVHRPGAIR